MIISKDYIQSLLEGIYGPGKVAYSQFTDEDTVSPPFCAFYYSASSNNLFADGKVYACFRRLYIESYTDTSEQDSEYQTKIENLLDSQGLPWQKESEWIESEHMYLTSYTMEVLTDV